MGDEYEEDEFVVNLKKLVLMQKTYIDLLSKCMTNNVGFLYSHNVYPKKEDIESGKRLRALISDLQVDVDFDEWQDMLTEIK